jgi:type I restriction enzyme S subunit
VNTTACGWQSRPLSELATTASGGTPNRNGKDYFGGIIPWVKSGELNDNCIHKTEEHITETGLRNSSAKIFPAGTVLIAMYGATVGKTAVLKANASTNQAICGISPGPDLDAEYLRYHLMFLRNDLLSQRYGGAQPNISQQIIRSQTVAYPPLSEQKSIAHTLLTVQRAIAAQERIIQTTTELKKALMQKLFTEGLRGEPQKETEIGLVPESWEVVPLGDIAKVGNGSTPKRNNPDYWEGGEIPWLNSSRIHDYFITQADQFVTPLAIKECHLPIVSPDSLLVAITGQGKTLGNTAITRIRTCVNQHLAYAQFHHPDIVPDFVLWYMQTRYEHFRSIAHGGGSTKGALTCGFLKKISIPVPPRREQSEISSAFHALDKKAHASMAKQAVLRQLFQALLDQLMSAKIRITNLVGLI